MIETETQIRKHEAVTKTICDICDQEIRKAGFDVEDVEMEYREGTQYPECRSVVAEVYDVCGPCWKSKIRPFMDSLGAFPRNDEDG